jgi:hypothetical protein
VDALVKHLEEEATTHDAAKPDSPPVLPLPKGCNLPGITCADCKNSIPITHHLAGKAVRCPACKHLIRVPKLEELVQEIVANSTPPPWFKIAALGSAFLLMLAFVLAIFNRWGSAGSKDQWTVANKEAKKQFDVPSLQSQPEPTRAVAGQLTRQLARDFTISAKRNRMGNLEKCLDFAAHREWALGLQQIPATVIDKGPLRHVPYKSFRAGDYEINVYGDPTEPAAIEAGIYKSLLRDKKAKSNCIDLICALLPIEEDRQIVHSLSLDKDTKERDGITFEITPETDEDAYGGWWLSLYNKNALEASRASPSELKTITTSPANLKNEPRSDNAVKESRWQPGDLKKARHPGRDVYVRDYVRKDGTYVHSHTRSRGRR